MEDLGFSAADLFETEPDAGLGNGGLGRLAACYLDSMTTLEIPATGYSICYELGIFKQKIIDGKQVELADNWLGLGDAWLIPKMDETEEVRFGGKIEDHWDENGRNTPVVYVGYTDRAGHSHVTWRSPATGTDHTNTLRLWDAKSPVPVDMSLYSRGEYLKAVEQQAMAEVIAKVLYPDDNHYEGKSLRLKQQYFFVSATAQSIVRQHRAQYGTLRNFHQKHVIQINDTHPTLVIPELMRILLDEEGYSWDEAWHIVTHTVCLHQPHRPGRGPGALAPEPDRDPAAPHLGDPEGDRRPLPAPAGARYFGGDMNRVRPDGHHLGRGGAHGQPVRVRLLRSQRRVRPPLRYPQAGRVP